MKKIFLTLILIISSASLFGYYSSENMIDMLVHSNQLRIRTDRLGALFGNRNIRAVVGLTGANIASGTILNNVTANDKLDTEKGLLTTFTPSVLGAIGYENDTIGVALGYEFTWKAPYYMVHTPILHMTAMNDSFRINIPVSIGLGSESSYNFGGNKPNLKGTMVISTGVEARYYFNLPIFSHIRVFFNYGNAKVQSIDDAKANLVQQSVGFQARAYFRHEFDYGMVLEPIIRVQFDTALPTRKTGFNNNSAVSIVDNYFITAKGFSPSDTIKTAGQEGSGGASTTGELKGGYIASIPNGYYAEAPYRIGVAIPLGFRATSEDKNIEFYLEPALSLTIVNAKTIYDIRGPQNGYLTDEWKVKGPFYTLGYVVYGELYIRPIPQLEWYSEIQTGGASVLPTQLSSGSSTSLVFNASTGITWYF